MFTTSVLLGVCFFIICVLCFLINIYKVKWYTQQNYLPFFYSMITFIYFNFFLVIEQAFYHIFFVSRKNINIEYAFFSIKLGNASAFLWYALECYAKDQFPLRAFMYIEIFSFCLKRCLPDCLKPQCFCPA